MEIEENYHNRNKTSENMWYRNKKKIEIKKRSMKNPQLFVNNEAGNTSLVFNNFLAEIF